MDAVLLLAVLSEIERTLVGHLVRDIVAAGPHGLWMGLTTPQGTEGLLLSAEATLPRIVCGAARPARTRLLPPLAGAARQRLAGTRFAGLSRRGLERVVRLDFDPAQVAGPEGVTSGSGGRLILEMFGSQPNLFLTDTEGRILEAARRAPATAERPYAPGVPYVPPPPLRRPDPLLLGSVDAVAAAIEPMLAAGLSPVQALRQGLAGVSDLWAREITARVESASPRVLAQEFASLLERIATGPPDPVLVMGEADAPVAVTPMRLAHLSAARQRPEPTLTAALEILAAHLARQQDVAASLGMMRRLLRRIEVRLRTRRTKLQAEAEEFARAATYQRMGEILVAHQGAVTRGASQVTLPDPSEGPGATLTVPLDPSLDPQANAERLFRLARRGRRGAVRVASRLAQTEADLSQIAALAAQVSNVPGPVGLRTVLQELEHAPRLFTPKDRAVLAERPAPFPSPPPHAQRTPAAPRAARERGKTGPEPRRFVSSEGLPILVGRDNEGNDHLTLHLARSEDLWLHAEGFPGSHVVVRMKNRTGGIPRQTLLEAAKLAAYYSQARTHGKVAVSYTLKKNVRKPRKSPAGLVTVTHEKTIVVKPEKELVTRLAKGSMEIDD